MPVDVSLYNRPIPDALSSVGSAVGVANGLIQNRMMQQELASKQAVGNAFQGAVGPDGTVDTGAAARAIQANPAAAYGAADALTRAAGLQSQNLSNQGASVAQSQGRMNDFYTSLGPLLANKNAPPTRAQVMGTATDLLHQGRLLPSDFAAITSEVPLDNGAVAGYAQNKFGSTMSPGEQASPGPTVTTPQGGFTPTKGQFFRGATAGGPTATAAEGTPVQTDRQGNAVSPTTGQKAPNAVPPPPGVQTGPAMGTSENITTNLNAYNADQQTASGRLANVRNLTTALPLMEQMGPGGAGVGSAPWNQLKSFLVTQGIVDPNTSDVNLRQEAAKYLYKYVSTNPVAARSDEAQNLAAASSPNLDLSMPAAIHLAKSAVGFDRMDSAVTKAYDLAHPGQQQAGPDYLKFKTDYTASHDPRAFSFDLLDPTEQRKLVSSLGPKTEDNYKKFARSLKTARDTGMVAAPNGGQ